MNLLNIKLICMVPGTGTLHGTCTGNLLVTSPSFLIYNSPKPTLISCKCESLLILMTYEIHTHLVPSSLLVIGLAAPAPP